MRLDQAKLSFEMDDDGNPNRAFAYVTREANHLVEEFMLAAIARWRRSWRRRTPIAGCFGATRNRTRGNSPSWRRSPPRTASRWTRRHPARCTGRCRRSGPPRRISTRWRSSSPRFPCSWRGISARETGGGNLGALRVGHEPVHALHLPHSQYPDVVVHRLVAAALDAGYAGRRPARARRPAAPGGGDGGAGGARARDASSRSRRRTSTVSPTPRPSTPWRNTVTSVNSRRRLSRTALARVSVRVPSPSPTVTLGVVRAVGRKYLCAYAPRSGWKFACPSTGSDTSR